MIHHRSGSGITDSPAICRRAQPKGRMLRVALRELCGVRSGDKGDTSDVTLFADNREVYNLLLSQVSADAVKRHFGSMVRGDVTRYEAPNVLGLKFVLTGALGGGGALSLRSDNLGKTLGGALLRMTVEAPNELVIASPRYLRRPPSDAAALVAGGGQQ